MVPDHVEYAGLARRIAAAVLDYLIISFGVMILHWIIFGNFGIAVVADEEGWQVATEHGWFSNIVFFVVTVILWVRLLGTPGKLLLGCHVVNAKTLHAITYKQAVIRYLSYIVSLLPFGLGFVWIALDRRHQGFHDKIAKTVVVLESHQLWDDESEKTLQQLVSELR